MRKLYSGFAILLVLFACSKDDTTTPEPEPVQVPKYTVTIKAGDGGTVSSAGGTYNKDSQFSVTATPNAEYLFQAWSDGNTDNPRTIKVGADLTITANFVKKQYDLTVTVVGDGAVAEEVVIQGGRYNSGSQIKLTATAAEGWEFTSWTGAIESTDNPVTVTLDGAKEVTATFTRKKFDLTITIEGEGTVTEEVVVQPAQYDYETQVKLTAVPETGWEFTAWSGDLESTENPVTVTVEDAQNITATFVLKDSDGDGVTDDIDQDNSTRQGVPVDENGVMLNPIYLDENGVTIKSQNWGILWDVGVVNGVEYTIVNELKVRNTIAANDLHKANFCTSLITNMESLFAQSNFNGDISHWDVSNVTNMESMFYGSSFDGNISNWDVSNVTNMKRMFLSSNFRGVSNNTIRTWDVSNVTDMSSMFSLSKFNGDVSTWDVSNVTEMGNMFAGSLYFNQNISNWDVSNVTNMQGMFFRSHFNQDISNWDVSNVTDMLFMFYEAEFNNDISNWNVSSVTRMGGMFSLSKFNGDISTWDVSNVTDMSIMFNSTVFNQDISNWNVSSVTKMGGMFANSKFNGSLLGWDVSNVTEMGNMFRNSMFNQDISNWDVSNVTIMDDMFSFQSQFNQDISNWDVSNVTSMEWMFEDNRVFNQDLSDWNVINVTKCRKFSNWATSWTLPKPNFTYCNPN